MFGRNNKDILPPVFAYPCMTTQGCPEAELKPGTPGYCPCWQSGSLLTETEINTGEERHVKGCYFQTMPRLMVHVIRASNRPAAELGKMRQSVVDGVRAEVADKMNVDLEAILTNLQINAVRETLAPPDKQSEQLEEITDASQSISFAHPSRHAQ